MKQTAKNSGKKDSQKKNALKIKKKQSKNVKTPEKRVKIKILNTFHSFMIVGVFIVFSACISLAVIIVRSGLIKTSVSEYEMPREITVDSQTEKPFDAEPGTAINPVFPFQESVNSVSTQQTVQERTDANSSQTTPVQTTPVSSAAESAVPQRLTEQAVKNLGTLVFVIDDAGNNLRELEPFLQIPGPLTIAVLPGLPYSAEAARRIRAAGKEVFLHQPMEAIGAQNPGPGAIYSGMNASEIYSILEQNVAEVGPVTGINNHQGSKITMDSEAVEIILAFCAENNLNFLDSRTTSESIVSSVAQKMGIQIAERNVFIDNEPDKEIMLHYISTALTRAQRYGSAVMIGHTWSQELAPLLAQQIPLFVNQGYTIKTASDIIMKR